MRIAVIGAGAAGLTAAYQLVKGGANVDVYESSSAVGGLARTLTLWDQKVDLGPHRFFSDDRRVNELWLEVVGRDYAMVNRLTRIHYRGKFFHYPLKPVDAFLKLGPREAARCLGSYLRELGRSEAPGASFEDWVVRRFGRRLFEIYFKAYSEKLWGIRCDELDRDFAAQRIKKLSLFEVVKNAFASGRGNTHKTLVEQFAYPLGGSGVVYERMASAVRDSGNRVRLGHPARGLWMEGHWVKGVATAEGEVAYDHVISTMPLPLLVAGMKEVPRPVVDAARALQFRNTILVYLNIGAEELFPDNWLYIHSPELRVGRITNFRNWVPDLYGNSRTSVVSLEYWCFDEDPLWTETDEALSRLARDEMKKTGLIGTAEIKDSHVHRIRRCYPVYRCGYKSHVNRVAGFLKGIPNLTVIGRYGAFKYNNQDHSLLMGLLAAKKLLSGGSPETTGEDLWEINTDYESYQEAARITEVGLVSLPDGGWGG